VKVIKALKVLNFPGVRSGRCVAGTGIDHVETLALNTVGPASFAARLMKQTLAPINKAKGAICYPVGPKWTRIVVRYQQVHYGGSTPELS
jgi:hypothetical protein